MDKFNEVKKLFGDASQTISNLLSPPIKGEVTTECFVLLKDLAHCGGNSPAPISIMKAGTVFRKHLDDDYFTDGFNLIARHIGKGNKEYFMYFTEDEGLELLKK